MYSGVTGADGKVYFGGRWMRDGAGGGLGWYDPKTGQAGGVWEPLSNYQVTHLAAVDQGRRIVISTLAVDDPVLGKPKPAQAALFFFDPALGKLVGSFETHRHSQGRRTHRRGGRQSNRRLDGRPRR